VDKRLAGVVGGILLLAAYPARGAQLGVARLSVKGASDGAATPLTGAVARGAAPLTAPIDLGSQPLGTLVDVELELCFRLETSPAHACDAPGRVELAEALAAPFHPADPFRVAAKVSVSSFPIELKAGQRLFLVVTWAADRLGPASDDLVLRAFGAGEPAEDVTLRFSGTGVEPGPCSPSFTTICLADDRFGVQASFVTPRGVVGRAKLGKLTADTGVLWFFDPANVEAVVKVLDACGSNSDRYWVFAGGLTNVRTVIAVTDTVANAVETYVNPMNTPFAPIQDTAAFATCP
jgi:hypothetical protein